MSTTLETKQKDSLFNEYISYLLEPKPTSQWLQSIANILRQLTNANFVMIKSFTDSIEIISSKPDLIELEKKTDSNNHCVYPLSVDGYLIVHWAHPPDEETTKNLKSFGELLITTLKNRSKIISSDKSIHYKESIRRIEEILSKTIDIKDQIKKIQEEILEILGASRCQIKQSSNYPSHTKSSLEFNPENSSEITKKDLIKAISIIPDFEKEWINKNISSRNDILEISKVKSQNNLDSLLAIKSYIGLPLIYNESPIGIIAIHQCDYYKSWNEDEKDYLLKIAVLLSIIIGKGNDNPKANLDSEITAHSNILSSDDFLRELSHLQIESSIKNKPFSIILIDIEKLKDINMNMGFVAGNLVLSQTARHLTRLYGEKYKIARYNSDEFVILLSNTNQSDARIEAEKLKEDFSSFLVLGIGIIEFNFSFATYPLHTESTAELLSILEQGMILSKSRGTSQVTGYDEIQGQSKNRWGQLVSAALPEIILKKSSLKTGPEVLENINKHLNNQKNVFNADILDSVKSLAIALDAKDSYTEGHSKRVSEYAYALAKELGLDQQEIEWIRLASTMHDIGKIGIPESILCKPAKLTKEEYEIMKTHPAIGARILKPIKPLEEVATLVLYHHEYWDGSGYPHGLKENDIPIGARIVSIVDAYQAMTSTRPYRSTLPQEEAIKRLREGANKQWEANLVERFISIIA